MRELPEDEDGLILRAFEALLDAHRLPKDHNMSLINTIRPKAVFDLVATAGFYSVLGYILMSYQTAIDEAIAVDRVAAPP